MNERWFGSVFSPRSGCVVVVWLGCLLASCSTAAGEAPAESRGGATSTGGNTALAGAGKGGFLSGSGGGNIVGAGGVANGGMSSATDPNGGAQNGGAANGGAPSAGAPSGGSGGSGGSGPSMITGQAYYLGVTVNPGTCLDAVNAGVTDGTELEEWGCNASAAQAFILDDVGSGAVRIVDRAAQKCVAPTGTSNDSGTKLVLAPCDGSERQKYTLKSTDGGRVNIVHKASGKCFDVPNASVVPGARIRIWDCNPSPAQQWTRAAIDTGYTGACGVAQLQNGRELAASCKNNDGKLVTPALDLSSCITNSDGKLAFSSEGGYAQSCSSCSLTAGKTLSCKCGNIAGSNVDTSLDLSGTINDCNGELTCGACGSGAPSSAGGKHALTALYGSDGNDFYRFTGDSSVANLKNSGWNVLFLFTATVHPNGDITAGGDTLATGGNYTGDPNLGANVDALKAQPTSVWRYEVSVGGWGDPSYDAIKSLVAAQGTGSGSILYKNFQALKKAVPGIDAINDDDEQTYDLGSSTAFGKMLDGLGMKLSLVPYMNQGFWVQLKNNLGGACDLVYLQCYQGGAGNDPGNWDAAFGNGFHVIPGEESNDHAKNRFGSWAANNGITGGFYWPDVTWAPGANWGVSEITSGLGLPP